MKNGLNLVVLSMLLTSCIVIEKGTIKVSTSVEAPKIKIEVDAQLKDVSLALEGKKDAPSPKGLVKDAEKKGLKYLGGTSFELKEVKEYDLKNFNYPSKEITNFYGKVKDQKLSICLPAVKKDDLKQLKEAGLDLNYNIDTSGILFEQTEGKDQHLVMKNELSEGKCQVFDLTKPVKKASFNLGIIAGAALAGALLLIGIVVFFIKRKKS